MINITINIPDVYDNALMFLKQLGVIPSRSEAIRRALRDFLNEELSFINILGDINGKVGGC